MAERAILLDLSESHLDKPPGSAAYEYLDVDQDLMPEGDHHLVGTINGTPVYLADPCLDIRSVDVDGRVAFSSGVVTLFDGEYSGSSIRGGFKDDFQGFDHGDLGEFVQENHERMVHDNEFLIGDCYILSNLGSGEADPSAPDEPVVSVTMKL